MLEQNVKKLDAWKSPYLQVTRPIVTVRTQINETHVHLITNESECFSLLDLAYFSRSTHYNFERFGRKIL